MKSGDFQPGFPGRLVPISGWGQTEGGSAARGVGFVPDPLPPKRLADAQKRCVFVGSVAAGVEEATRHLFQLAGLLETLPNPWVLLGVLQRKESERSSTIEDTVASLEEVAAHESGAGSSNPAASEVLNNFLAVEHAVTSPLPMCNRLLRDCHRVLMAGARGKDKHPGEFRGIQVQIGGRAGDFGSARFVPPPPGEELEASLGAFERALNGQGWGGGTALSWLIETAMLHYQFEAIHPFHDGNGRLGRLLVHVLPIKRGWLKYPILNISEYLAADRAAYYDALRAVSTHDDWEGWTNLFCRAVATQAEADLSRTRRLLELRQKTIEAVGPKRSSGRIREAIDVFFHRLALSNSGLCKALKVTAPTAQKCIDTLEGAGFLREVTGRRRDRHYVAMAIIDVLNGPPRV